MSIVRRQIRILGCGSSGGVPRIGGDWGACDPANPLNRRSRCSILIRQWSEGSDEPTQILVDTSPDIRHQLLDAGVKRLDAVFMTHRHADQTHGMDDLRALVLVQRSLMPVYMDDSTADDLRARFGYCFTGASAYPPILELRRELAPGREIVLGEGGPGGAVKLTPLLLDHGTISSLGLRLGAFGYCNDVVRIPEETLGKLHGLDMLVVDALRDRPHPTHANVDQALAWIEALKPRRAVLTNLHTDLDYEALKGRLPANVEPAFDGMEFDVPV